MLIPENGWKSDTYPDSQDVLIYDEENTSQPATRTLDLPSSSREVYLSGSHYFTIVGNVLYFRPESLGEFSCVVGFRTTSPVNIGASNKRTGYKFPGKYMDETEGIIGCWHNSDGTYSVQLRVTGRCVKPVLSIDYIQEERFDFGPVAVNDSVTRQAYLYNIGSGDLTFTIEKDGEGDNVSGTDVGSEIWIQESNFTITQLIDFDINNTRSLLSYTYAPTGNSESFFYYLNVYGEIITFKGTSTRPLSSYGWYKQGDWDGLPGNEFKFILRDITNAIHERERVLGFGELDDEEAVPIRIAKINGTPKSGDMTVRERNVKLEGSCSDSLESIYVNGLIKGVKYERGKTTWSWEGLLLDGKNRVTVTGFTKLNVFCFPDEMEIFVDRFAPTVIAHEVFNTTNGYTKIRLKFNEDIEETSLSANNFSLTPNEKLPVEEFNVDIDIANPTVISVVKFDVASIELTTTKLAENIRYTLTTTGLTDIVGNQTSGEGTTILGGIGKPSGVELSMQFKTGVYSTGSQSLSVSGSCNKNGDVRQVIVHDTLSNEFSLIQILPTQRVWAFGISLEQSITNFIFYEVDSAGATSLPTYLRIVYTGGGTPSVYTPPVLTSPAELSSYTQENIIQLSGTSESSLVSINGVKVSVNNGAWAHTHQLRFGSNIIEIISEYWENDALNKSEPVFAFIEYDPNPLRADIFSIEFIERGGETFNSISKYINESGVAIFVVKFSRLIHADSFNPETDITVVGASVIQGSSVANSFYQNGTLVSDTWTFSIQISKSDAGRVSMRANVGAGSDVASGSGIGVSNEFSFFYDRLKPKLHSVRIHGKEITPDSGVEIDSSGPVNIEVFFTKPIKNFSSSDISITSNANIINFRAARLVEYGTEFDVYRFAISPRVTGAKIYMDISPTPYVTDLGGNQIDLDGKGGPYIINYKQPNLDNPWKRANKTTQGRIIEEEPCTYWLKPDIWIKPCDPNMVTVYWVRPNVGKSSKSLGIMSDPPEDYFVGIPLTAMFTERDVYFVTKECDEESGDINSTIQEMARVYDLVGGTMTAQMSEFNDTCRYRLHKQEWRIPYMPMGDLINSMRLAIEKLVNVGHRKGPTHYVSRYCRWVDKVPYRSILNPITLKWEVEEFDYGFWKIWTLEELLLDVNTKATWLADEDTEKNRAMWVDYTKGHTLNKKIWFQLRDVLNRLTCVKWDIGICGLPGNCESPFGYKGNVKKFGYNVCDRGWSSLAKALNTSPDADSQYARGGYYPVFDYGYAITRGPSFGVEIGFSAKVSEVIPNESMAYPDIGWGSGARSLAVDVNTIPGWSTAYVKGTWVDTWVVAILSAEGITPNSKYLGYSEPYSYNARQDGRTDDFLYGGCILPGSGASLSISEGASGVNWALGGGGVTSGGTAVYSMDWYSSPSLTGDGSYESNACTRSIYTRHQTFDWGGICYARGGSGIINYGDDHPDKGERDAAPTSFNLGSSAGNLTPEVEVVERFGREFKIYKYPYPFTWQQDKVGGGPFGSSGVVGHPARPSKKIRGHVKFKVLANPQAYGNNLNIPGGAATSFVVTNCLNVLHYRDTTDFDNDFCDCNPGHVASRGENGFALDNCSKNLTPGVSGAKYPGAWDQFRSASLGLFTTI
jgi:hypothetical protein